MPDVAVSKVICWCGSGLPYRNCHLSRAQQKTLTRQETLAALKRHYNRGYCLHPDAPQGCSGDIVKAHTIQRNGSLDRIARDGHVYGFRRNVFGVEDGEPPTKPELVGIKRASTFTGFCGHHDRVTFEPIEKHPFEGTPQQAFLFGYRAFCREEFAKVAALDNEVPLLRSRDRGRPEDEQRRIQASVAVIERGLRVGLEEVHFYKAIYDDLLRRADYNVAKYYIIQFDRAPEVMCSGATQPEFDFTGRRLQDWSDLRGGHFLDYISFSLAGTDTGGAAVFSWVGGNRPAEAFIRSLDARTDDGLPQALIRFAFEYFENIYLSPGWWEGLEAGARQRLLERQWTFMGHTSDCLMDDGIRSVSWTVLGRKTNAV